MTSNHFVKKIRNYAVVSFLLPLIAINSCLLIYKYIGDLKVQQYPSLNWGQAEHSYTYEEYNLKTRDLKSYRFASCPKHDPYYYFTTIDNQIIPNTSEYATLIENLMNNNKIKSVIIKEKKTLNKICIKNYQAYSLIKKFSWLDKLLVKAKVDNSSGFTQIKNPYFYGEVSISRTARFFPTIIIFKSLIILSALLLFFLLEK